MSQASYAELARLTEVFLTELRKYPGLMNLDTDLRLNTPELRVRVDRDKMADGRQRGHGRPDAGIDARRTPW